MARVARRDGTGVCHHVLQRGIERRAIFRDDFDRQDFVSRLRQQLREGGGGCLAWVLMTNHVHLVLRTGERTLSNVMRRLDGGYARAFNLRHGRCGYLFQDRFRSIVVEDDAYLRVLIRYVHLNPLRARMVDSLEALAAYRWGGHAELLGGVENGLLSKDEVWSFFGPTPGEAQRALLSWMRAGQRPARDDAYLPAEAGRLRSPGPEAPASGAPRWEPSGRREPAAPEIRAQRLGRAGWTLDALVGWACERLGADPAAVRAGRRTRQEARARAVIAALATRDLDLPLERVARATGVTSGPLCRAIERGVRVAGERELRLDEAGPVPNGKQATPSPSRRIRLAARATPRAPGASSGRAAPRRSNA